MAGAPRTSRLWVALWLASASAGAQSVPPAPRPDEQFDVMNLITAHGLHDIQDESWNTYGQATYISSWKLGFPAPYTNRNTVNGSPYSLVPQPERSFTGSATLYFGVRLWKGAEGYVVPEVISEKPLSGLHGLGGSIQNFELQKGGSPAPQLYHSRIFIRQTFELGGQQVVKASDPLQLGTHYQGRRIVLSAGNFSVLDFFEKNTVLGDLHQTFLNLGFLTYAAYDFNSDARGYSWGAVAELYWDDWALRLARVTPPRDPNVLAVDFRLLQFYGDQLELEHTHVLSGHEGAVRVLLYRNRNTVGRFDNAVTAFETDPRKNAASCTGTNYGSTNSAAPDLCWVRKPNLKVGVGLSLEQHLSDDVGVFIRGMLSDGQSEVDAYTSTDSSLSLGVLAKGVRWKRPKDLAGIGGNVGWISKAHSEFLRRGGVDGFIGDGSINVGAERSVDVFYSLNVLSAVWLSADYQHIINPGFNQDRGPVHVLAGRLHAEF